MKNNSNISNDELFENNQININIISQVIDNKQPTNQQQINKHINSKFIIQELKRFKIPAVISKVIQSSLLTSYVIKLDDKVNIDRVMALNNDLNRSLKAVKSKITNTYQNHTIILEIPKYTDFHRNIFDFIKQKTQLKQNIDIPIALGETSLGNDVFIPLSNLNGLLISGDNEKDRNNVVYSIIINLIFNENLNNLKITLIDNPDSDLNRFSSNVKFQFSFKETSQIDNKIKQLAKRHIDILNLMRKIKAKTISQFNKIISHSINTGNFLSSHKLLNFDDNGDPIFENKNIPLDKKNYEIVIICNSQINDKNLKIIKNINKASYKTGIYIIISQHPSQIAKYNSSDISDTIENIICTYSKTALTNITMVKDDDHSYLSCSQDVVLYNSNYSKRIHIPKTSQWQLEKITDWTKKNEL